MTVPGKAVSLGGIPAVKDGLRRARSGTSSGWVGVIFCFRR
ncbi:MAG: hypothetical protein AB1523_00765 [Bacillota bacterium]